MRTPRDFDPLRLHVEAFAKQGESLGGRWPLASMPRLVESCDPQALPGPDEEVAWSARGERRERLGAAPEIWLHLGLDAIVRLECQRCLEPVAVPLRVARSLRFVPGEAEAAALDGQGEDDVLPLSRSLDLRQLAEDELLLALPLVPRHEACPRPLAGLGDAASGAPPAEIERRPFEVLRSLKPPPGERH